MTSPQTTSLQITGMGCASCVGRVENALRARPGVTAAEVNFATKTARIDHSVPLADLTQTLAQAGYPVAQAEAVLEVEGLNCASCVGRVERALSAAPGVLHADVNLANKTARVVYAQGITDTVTLAKVSTHAGYAAHPRDIPGPAKQQDESALLKRQTLLAAVLALPVFVLEMGGHAVPAFHHWVNHNIGQDVSQLIQLLLTTALLIGPGRMFYIKGVPALWRGVPDMNALVALGTGAAYGYSLIATFLPWLLPEGTANIYYEAAAVIVVLILLGRWMEARAKGRTGAAVTALIGLRPDTAHVERNGQTRNLPIGDIVPGDILHLRPGERVAVDGIVLDGNSYLDESMITGEPMPVAKKTDDDIIGGTVNTTGTLRLRATKVGADTVLARIIDMVEQAQGAKLPIQGLVDRITLWFVPAVLTLAALTVLAWLIFGPDPALSLALVAGVSVLIIACPCAMGLATPTSIMVGTGRAAELGVLFRKGDALQRLQQARVVAFDKTGTLTQGHPALTDLTLAEGFDRNTVLRLAASAEAQSEHPIARAITHAWDGDLAKVHGFESLTGFGLRAQVAGHDVLIGADRLFANEGIPLTTLTDSAQSWAEIGKTPLYIAIDGQAAAVLAVADPIKPGTADVISRLHEMGLTVAMITGDNTRTAKALAKQLQIDHVTAEVLPEGKVTALEMLRSSYGTLAFVGDGINDAPALATADIGIAIGTGTDVAIEAADVVLMSGDLRGVSNALQISRATMRNIRQNLGWAFGYNILLIPVAAGVLYPFGGPLLSPIFAAGAMALSSVFVVSNALRLRRVRANLSEARKPTPLPQPAEQSP